MSGSLALACVWVLAATVTAFLPMRLQYPPGIALLIAVPFLLGYIGWQHGFWIAALAVLGFASIFRNPLIYMVRKIVGKPVSRPEADRP